MPVAGAERVAGLRGALRLVAAAAIGEACCFALLAPVLADALADRFPRALWWAAGFAVAACLAFVADRWSMARLRARTTEVVAGLQHRIGDHATALPLGWFTPAAQDRLTRLLGGASSSLAMILGGIIAVNVRAAVLGVAIVVVTACIDPVSGVVALAGLALLGGLYRLATRILRGGNVESTAAAQAVTAEVLEFAQKQSVLRASGRLEEADSDLHRAMDRARSAAKRYFRGAIAGATLFALGSAGLLSAVLVAAVLRADAGAITPAAAVTVVVYAALVVDAVAALGRTGSVIWAAEADVAAMAELLATAPLPEPERSAAIADSSVRFEDVRFGYGAEPVLDGVRLTVPPGGTCAVVGPSGSGKTTLVRLAARFFDVTGGAVRIGGADVRDLRSEDLAAQLAVVFQDVYLFDGTIEENVRMGRPGVTGERLADVARRARLDELIERLPEGWATRVGDRGTALSGGERQRVSIARALLKDAPVVLLDEATSALDPENERAVRAALGELGEGRTRLVVAHRLATVADADVIVFLEGGRAAETGTHAELLARGGRYARFWAVQGQAPRNARYIAEP